MFSKTLLLALFAASAQIATAAVPGCLLGAINTAPNPADLGSICDSASKYQSKIQDICGDNTDAALKSFASSCKAVGKTVASPTGSGSRSKTTPTATKPASTILYTSTYSDADCKCEKTKVVSSVVPASTEFATATNADASATGSATSTGAGALPTANAGSLAAILLGAGAIMVL